jgi:tRNA pseudouridine55 synthase
MIAKVLKSVRHHGNMSQDKASKMPSRNSVVKYNRLHLCMCSLTLCLSCLKFIKYSFSALKMNGIPLYEYARSGTPLPRPIEQREVTVHSLELTHWIPGSEHSYGFPEKKFTEEERRKLERALKGSEITAAAESKDEVEAKTSSDSVNDADGTMTPEKVDEACGTREERPPAFVISMRVSGGTYVRCIAHDIGHAVGSAAHVVTLTRSRQGRFCLLPDAATATPKLPSKTVNDGEKVEETEDAGISEDKYCLPWDLFSTALENGWDEKVDGDGWREWERKVMDKMEVVQVKGED